MPQNHEHRQHAQNVLRKKRRAPGHYLVCRAPDGSLRWKCARYTYFGDDGSILLNVRDVHAIRIAQQQEENRFRAILRETCEYIIETDAETKSYTLHLPTLINRYPLADCSDYGSLIARYSERDVAPEESGGLPAGGVTPGSAEPYAQGRRLMLHQVHGEYQRLPGLQDMEHVPVPL